MAHGYLGDGYGSHGEIGDDRDRERGWRGHDNDWRDRGPERDRDQRTRERGMMFDDARSDRQRWSDRGREGQEFRWEQNPNFSANPDDHYRSWRDRHMSELDRDYQDYCREREQQFHREFDDWRRGRSGNPQPLRTGMTQTGLSADPSGMTELETESEPPLNEGSDPMAAATLGTTSRRRG